MNPQPKTKTIRLKGKDYAEFRKKVAIRSMERCDTCGGYAPLLWNGCFDLYKCGHVAHITSRGAGGGDVLDNVKWKCYYCHMKEHTKGG